MHQQTLAQLTPEPDTTALLGPNDRKRIQQIVGVFLYYARAIDCTMLVALSSIAAAQATGTEATMDAVVQLLNYAASHPDAVIRFVRSDMYLHVHNDGSYLSELMARSRAAGYFYLSDRPEDPSAVPKPTDPPPTHNGPILVNANIMRQVVSSAAECEIGTVFYNGKDAVSLRTTLEELGHEQGPTPMQTDNNTASGFANDEIKQRRSKAIDMRFYWVRDRSEQGQFLIYWAPGAGNLADYFSKHHPASHHRAMRPVYLQTTKSPSVVRGCVDSQSRTGQDTTEIQSRGIHDSTGDDIIRSSEH
jgi:hypothetical protein